MSDELYRKYYLHVQKINHRVLFVWNRTRNDDEVLPVPVSLLQKIIFVLRFPKKHPINILRQPDMAASSRKKGDAVMRIEAYNQIASVYKSNGTVKTQKSVGVAGGKDQVQISQIGRDYQIAKQAVAEASDIREDKVAELKTKVQSGNYNVDSGDFASVLLAKYNAQ